jgi:hypothetical protein
MGATGLPLDDELAHGHEPTDGRLRGALSDVRVPGEGGHGGPSTAVAGVVRHTDEDELVGTRRPGMVQDQGDRLDAHRWCFRLTWPIARSYMAIASDGRMGSDWQVTKCPQNGHSMKLRGVLRMITPSPPQ